LFNNLNDTDRLKYSVYFFREISMSLMKLKIRERLIAGFGLVNSGVKCNTSRR